MGTEPGPGFGTGKGRGGKHVLNVSFIGKKVAYGEYFWGVNMERVHIVHHSSTTREGRGRKEPQRSRDTVPCPTSEAEAVDIETGNEKKEETQPS